MTTITLSSRGQIVVPAHIRKKLGMSAGDQFVLAFDEKKKELTLQPAETIDQMSDRINSWIKPGTEPLLDTRTLYRSRELRMGDA
ncbi:MAG: AbrB/MazE/SpoVT family DNA-binding domain-containing protein [Coriobacteriia bacterium]|nr:AbrB/MazE/SpoVT family DNA-binding domain-containing protein [Coriobacteriia bacterium]